MATRHGFIAGAGALAAGASAATTAFGAPTTASTSVVPTQKLLQRLLDGNKRFVAADIPGGERLAERREMLLEGQSPFAAVLTCADSRIIPNLLFLQGPGDLFTVRLAGNYASDDILGSLEYAVEHLTTRLIVVLGHENCGAVKAVYDAIAKQQSLPKHLDAIERGMRDAIAPVVAEHGTLEAAMRANVRATVARIVAAQRIIAPAVERHAVQVVGAEYQLGTGAVHLLSKGA